VGKSEEDSEKPGGVENGGVVRLSPFYDLEDDEYNTDYTDCMIIDIHTKNFETSMKL
jgi:hypothetical protein